MKYRDWTIKMGQKCKVTKQCFMSGMNSELWTGNPIGRWGEGVVKKRLEKRWGKKKNRERP